MRRNDHVISGSPAAQSLGTQAEQGEDLAQVHQPLGLALFSRSQSAPLVLLVEECLEQFLDPLGEPKTCEIPRHLNFNLDGLRHSFIIFTIGSLTGCCEVCPSLS